jgi:hypothetical protein
MVLLAGPLLIDPARYRAAERVIAEPAALSKLTAGGEQAMTALNDATGAIALAQRGVRVSIRYIPLAFHVVSWDGRQAQIEIWGLWLIAAEGVLPATQTWSTTSVRLAWLADWKFAASSTSPGPVPQLGQPATAGVQVPAQLADFEEYQHASRP